MFFRNLQDIQDKKNHLKGRKFLKNIFFEILKIFKSFLSWVLVSFIKSLIFKLHQFSTKSKKNSLKFHQKYSYKNKNINFSYIFQLKALSSIYRLIKREQRNLMHDAKRKLYFFLNFLAFVHVQAFFFFKNTQRKFINRKLRLQKWFQKTKVDRKKENI